MFSAHLVDPEVRDVLDRVPTAKLNDAWVAGVRELMNPGFTLDETAEVAVRELHLPGPTGAPDVRVLAYRPREATEALPGLIDIHGGGYVAGSADGNHAANLSLATSLKCAIYSVDYRLAPESPYPGPVEDCYAVTRWLFANAQRERVDKSRIGIRGASAGGGLAAATVLLARDRGEFNLAFQHLNCPMLDDRTVLRRTSPVLGEYIWTPHNNEFGWRALIGGDPGQENISPYCAPARAADLAGLPPSYINVGALDLFLEEDMEYARRLAVAGVPTELHVYPGGFHGFELAPEARISKASGRDSLEALRRAMFG